MSWNTPKTDWAVPDVVTTTDLNEIGENLQELHIGNGSSFYPSAITSANELPILDTLQSFYIDGNTNIEYIYVGNRSVGSTITLVFATSTNIDLLITGSSPSAGYGIITSNATVTVKPYECVDLILIGAAEWVVKYLST